MYNDFSATLSSLLCIALQRCLSKHNCFSKMEKLVKGKKSKEKRGKEAGRKGCREGKKNPIKWRERKSGKNKLLINPLKAGVNS